MEYQGEQTDTLQSHHAKSFTAACIAYGHRASMLYHFIGVVIHFEFHKALFQNTTQPTMKLAFTLLRSRRSQPRYCHKTNFLQIMMNRRFVRPMYGPKINDRIQAKDAACLTMRRSMADRSFKRPKRAAWSQYKCQGYCVEC